MKVSTNLKAGQANAIAVAVGAANVSLISQRNIANHNVLSTISQSNYASVSQSASNSGAVTAAAVGGTSTT
jgi:hypothetical protein